MEPSQGGPGRKGDEAADNQLTINCDIKRILEKLKGVDKLPPEKASAVKLQSETTLKKLKTINHNH